MSSDIRAMRAALVGMREEWASRTNRALERAGCDQRVSHLSHVENGIPLVPTIHIGAKANAAMRGNSEYNYGSKRRNREATADDESLVSIACTTARERTRANRRRARTTDLQPPIRRRNLARPGDGGENLVGKWRDPHRRSSVSADSAGSGRSDQSTPLPDLDRLKKEISLRNLAGVHGWVVDLSGGSGQMRHPDRSREIVIMRADDGHWTYFSRNGSSSGSVIDFCQNELSWGNLGEVRRRLAEILSTELPEPAAQIFLSRPPKRAAAPAHRDSATRAESRESATYASCYLRSRALTEETLSHFAQSVEFGSNETVRFAHSIAGGSGYEYRGPDAKGFSKGGKRGLWMSRPGRDESVIVVCESAIDCMSHAQAHGLPSDAVYLSTGGGFGLRIVELIVRLAIRVGAKIVAAFDNDEAGERMHSQLRQEAERRGVTDRFERDCPTAGKDWNDVIQLTANQVVEIGEDSGEEAEGQKI